MKKYIIAIIILCLLAITLLIVWLLPQKGTPKIDSLVKDLIDSEKELTSIDNYYNPKEYELIEEDTDGLISLSVYDFNGDSKEEVLVSRIKNNDLVLYLYAVADDKLEELDSILLIDGFLDFPDTIYMDCFIMIIDDVPYLFVESTGYSNLVADGINWDFIKLGFSHNKFIKINKKYVTGSYFEDDEISELKRIVKDADLSIDSLSFEENGKSLFAQNKEAKELFSVKREHLKDFDESKYYDSSETRVKYGVTEFSKFNKNKIYLEF